MFVIATKNSKTNSYIVPLVKSIRQYHKTELILICDSNSEDMSYIEEIKQIAVDFKDKGNNIHFSFNNRGYIDSAVFKALEDYPEQEFFHVLHDSMLLKSNLDHLKSNDFTSYMYFSSEKAGFDNLEQQNYVTNSISEKTQFSFNPKFTGLFGITFSCKRWVLEKLKEGGLNNVIPSNKNEACGSERVWGICLDQIGIDIKENSIAGDYFNRKPNPEIIKYFAGRN